MQTSRVLAALSIFLFFSMPIKFGAANESLLIPVQNAEQGEDAGELQKGDQKDFQSDEEKSLFDTLAGAENETEGRYAEDAVWQFWFNQSPTSVVRRSLDAGLERREAYDFEAAEIHFDKVVQDAPDYAEGYNQRAFIRFLRQNYSGAEKDLIKVLDLKPYHFAALSGLFHVHNALGKPESATLFLQEALRLHPWLKERFALPKRLWPESTRLIHDSGTEI